MIRLSGKTIGDRIKVLRLSEGLTQSDMAKKLILSSGGIISAYENNRRQMPLEVVIGYSEEFGVSTDWILKGKETA